MGWLKSFLLKGDVQAIKCSFLCVPGFSFSIFSAVLDQSYRFPFCI